MDRVGELIKSFFKDAKGLLAAGLKDAAVFELAIDRVESLAATLYQKIEKQAPRLLTVDETTMSISAQVGADAIGTDTVAKVSLDATLIERPLVTIGLATAISFAAAEVTAVATFTGCPGADVSFTKIKTFSGENFEACKEMLVGIDLSFLDLNDRDLDFTRETNVLANGLRADIGEGNLATVEFSVEAVGENTLAYVEADATVVEDMLSSAYVGADLYIA